MKTFNIYDDSAELIAAFFADTAESARMKAERVYPELTWFDVAEIADA
jgi:hypothetical protein